MNRNKIITFGDKIFARVTKNGQTILNFVSEKVANLSDLYSQLRLAMKDFQGLVMIHIRNYNRGWGEERPLMLYERKEKPFMTIARKAESEVVELPVRNMYFPWETH